MSPGSYEMRPAMAGAMPVPFTGPSKPTTSASGDEPSSTAGSDHEAGTDPLPELPPLPPGLHVKELLDERENLFTREEKDQAWSDAAGMVKAYSDEMILRWNKEIDTYLVFAGLFSAILTAFNVQSYLLLQPAPSDPTLVALQQISAQLSSFSINPPFLNSTRPAVATSSDSAPPPVPGWAIWLNALWFAALVLSLASASTGIMVKQWLNEYESGLSGISRPAARARQYRLNNLLRWRVADVVVVIPVLLQVALFLFLAGLLILLWTLHRSVAITATLLVGVHVSFTFGTTLLPLVVSGCAYVSPQTLVLYSAFQYLKYPLYGLRYLILVIPARQIVQWRLDYGWRFPLSVLRALLRISGERGSAPVFTWQGRQQSAITRLRSNTLDVDILLAAYKSALQPQALTAAAVCLVDYPPSMTINYFRKLRISVFSRHEPVMSSSLLPTSFVVRCPRLLWIYVLLAVLEAEGRGEKPLSSQIPTTALCDYVDVALTYPPEISSTEAEWVVSAYAAMIECLQATPRWDSRVTTAFSGAQRLLNATVGRGLAHKKGLPLAVSQAHRGVARMHQRLVTDSTGDQYSRYLASVRHFLECAAHALASPMFPTEERRATRSHVWQVLAELSRTIPVEHEGANPSQFWMGKERSRLEMLQIQKRVFLDLRHGLLPRLSRICSVDAELVPGALMQRFLGILAIMNAEKYGDDSQIEELRQAMRGVPTVHTSTSMEAERQTRYPSGAEGSAALAGVVDPHTAPSSSIRSGVVD